jgi:hypothetical protein
MLDQKNQERVQYNQSCNRRPVDQLRSHYGERKAEQRSPDSGRVFGENARSQKSQPLLQKPRLANKQRDSVRPSPV